MIPVSISTDEGTQQGREAGISTRRRNCNHNPHAASRPSTLVQNRLVLGTECGVKRRTPRLGSYLLRQLREHIRKSEKVFYFSSLGLSV